MTKKKTNIINLPTILTLIRVILVIPLFVLIFFDNLPAKILTLAFFIVASVTDFVDGYLARKNKQVTDLGAFLDPLADKMLVNLAFLVLVYLNVIPLWVFAVILVRDFAVDGMRMMSAREGKTISASSREGYQSKCGAASSCQSVSITGQPSVSMYGRNS